MRTDVVIVGDGFAGFPAADIRGRARRVIILVDPHPVNSPDFRCGKLEQGPIAALRRTGLAEAVIHAWTHTGQLWVAHYGRIVDTMRDGPDRRRVGLPDGRTIDARLVVPASGSHRTMRSGIGPSRDLVGPCRSITVGFDLKRVDGVDFAFPSLRSNFEKTERGVAYLTLSRIGAAMRANRFRHGRPTDDAGSAFRSDPDGALQILLLRLARLTGAITVVSPVEVRPTVRHALHDPERPGVVLVGDAFAMPWPATGTGSLKVLSNVERLCDVHVPRWLETPGMEARQIGTCSRGPVRTSCDAPSGAEAYRLRSLSVDHGLNRRLQRGLRFCSRLVRWAIRSALRRSPGRAGLAHGGVAPRSAG